MKEPLQKATAHQNVKYSCTRISHRSTSTFINGRNPAFASCTAGTVFRAAADIADGIARRGRMRASVRAPGAFAGKLILQHINTVATAEIYKNDKRQYYDCISKYR